MNNFFNQADLNRLQEVGATGAEDYANCTGLRQGMFRSSRHKNKKKSELKKKNIAWAFKK